MQPQADIASQLRTEEASQFYPLMVITEHRSREILTGTETRFPHSFCTISITCFKGSVLTLFVPVNGWSRIYIRNKINVIVTVISSIIMYFSFMLFIP